MALDLTLYTKNETSSDNLVILIHGLGASRSTWIHNNVSWIDLFLSDPALNCLDVAEVRYDTSHLANGLLALMGVEKIKIGRFRSFTVGKGPYTNLEILARELKREIDSQKIKQYKNIILIGHSMGGLVAIRYILEEFENNQTNNIKGFISLATPYNGSSYALYSQLIKSINRHAQIPSLEPNSNFLDETIRLWQKHLDKLDLCYKFFFGTDDTIVPENSAIPHIVSSKWTGGIPLPGDHSGILNVKNHNSTIYIHVSEAVKEILEKDILIKKKKIDEQRKLIMAKSITRLKANGLDRDQAVYILDKKYNFEYLLPNDDKRLIVIVGEFGMGKSFAIDQINLDLLTRAEKELDFPIPISLNAAQLDTDVQSYLENIIVDNHREYWILVDGMDEVSVSITSNILDNMRIATERWDNIRIILTSRPQSILNNITEKVYMKGLSETEAINLINFINNEEKLYHLHSLPGNIKDAVKRPLFAILLGIYLRKNNSLLPKTSGELLAFLIEKSLEKVEINESQTKQLLMKLAVKSTFRGNIPVEKYEVADLDEISDLLNSGIIVEENDYLSFVLPILNQWFAAKALSEGMVSIDQIFENNNIDYWKYPLIVLITIFKENKIDNLLSKIVEKDPGFAAILIEESIEKWGSHTNKNPLSAFQSGEKIRIAMTSWVKSLGNLAEVIAPVDINRNILPIGVKKDGEWIDISWYKGKKKIPEINVFENRIDVFEWKSWRGAIPRGQSWYWRWTLEELRDNLTKIIKNKSLPICTEIIYKELMWSATLKVIKKGSLYTKEVSLEEIKSSLNREYQNKSYIEVDKTIVPMSMYMDYITVLENKGIDVVECPLPGEDIDNPKENWVWSAYSDEQLYLRTIKIYKEVVIGYKDIVETFFPILKNRLRKYVLYPFILKGKYEKPESNGLRSFGPGLKWHLEPLPLDNTDFILDIKMSKRETSQDNDNLLSDIEKKIKKFRPNDCTWIYPSQTGQILDIFGATPVTDIIYDWLKKDLKMINWIN